MRLLRLKVTNFRGVVAREVVFPDQGVLVLAGGNEVGKSTMFGALDLLFDKLSDSGHGDVKAAAPLDRDASPEVELELQLGARRLVFRKRWSKRKDRLTELRELSPEPRTWTGREAHNQALAWVQEALDLGLWRALCVRQAVFDAEALALSGHQALAAALDAAAQGTGGPVGEESGGLVAAVAEQAARYHTARSGKETRELAEARKAQLDAQADLVLATGRSQGMADEVRQLEDLQATLPALTDAVAGTRRAATETAAVLSKVRDLQDEVGRQQAQLSDLQDLASGAREALQRREAQEEDLAVRTASLTQQRAEQDVLVSQQEELLTQHAAAAQTLESLRRARVAAAEALARARADRDYLSDLRVHGDLTDRLEAIGRHREALAVARAAVVAHPVTAGGLAKLVEAVTQRRIAEESLKAAGAAVQIRADQDLAFTVDGQEQQLSAGQVRQVAVASELTLAVPGALHLAVSPGAGLESLRAQVKAAQAAAEAQRQVLQVEDLEGAEAAHTARSLAEKEVARHTGRLEDLLGRHAESHLRAELAVVSTRLEGRDPGRGVPGAGAETEAAVEAARVAEAEAGAKVSAAEAAEQALRQRMEAGRTVTAESGGRLEQAEIERERLDRELVKARTSSSDDVLRTALSERVGAVTALENRVDKVAEALRQADPDSAKLFAENAERARDDTERNLQEAMNKRGALEAVLASRGEDGIAEALDRATTLAQRADQQLERVARRACAARLLAETLDTARREAHAAHARPLADRVQALGRIVWGPDWSVRVDSERLSISERVLGGVAVPYEQLSVGAREQLGILTRVAAAQLISGDDTLPLVLDDALGHTDPRRMVALSAVLAQAGRQLQLVVLTSNPARWAHIGGATTVVFD